METSTLVWRGIKDDKRLEEGADPLDESEFIDIYAPIVKDAINKKRQYMQVRAAKPCFGK